MLLKLLRLSLNTYSSSLATAIDHLVFRVAVGLMIFYIHGWHNVEGWLAYRQRGTPWKLVAEVAEMKFPAPAASAPAATLVQFVSYLLSLPAL